MRLNLMQIASYYDLTFQEREHVLLAISKPKAFFESYFNNLKHARTRIECFNKLNDLHLEIYESQMYSCFQSFTNQYSRYVNKK